MSNQTTPVEFSDGSFQQFSLRDILIVLFRRRWVILGIALPIIAFGAYGTWTTADSWTAEAQVLIDARSVEDPSFRERPLDYDVLMNTAAQVAQSIPVADGAAQVIFPEVRRIIDENSLTLPVGSEDDLRDMILEKFNCGQVGESNILSLSYAHEDPDLAVTIVQGMMTAFMDYWVESRRNSNALDYYSEQIAIVQGEIDSLMVRRAGIYSEKGINAFPVNNSAGIQQMRQMEYSYFQARSNRMEKESQYQEILARVQSNPDDLPSVLKGNGNASLRSSFNSWEDARLELAKLRMTYQEDSTHIQRQKEFVEETRQLFVEARDSFLEDLRVDLSTALAREKSLEEALGEYREKLEKFPGLEMEISSLDMQINTQRDLLEALYMKRGEVRLTTDSDARTSNITPLNEPSVYFGVSGGKKVVYLGMTLVLALVLGVVAAFLVDAQDHRIFDPRQAEKRLMVPVLGTISTAEIPSGKQ